MRSSFDTATPHHHQLAGAAFAARPPDSHAMGIAGQVMAACGRAADAVGAWRAAADSAPGDADVAAGWFNAAAACLDYPSMAPAATRLARLDPGEGRAWWPAAATALQALAAPASSPLGRAGLLKLARAMVERLQSGGDQLSEQQRLLVERVSAPAAGWGDEPAEAEAAPAKAPAEGAATSADAPSACLAGLPPARAPDAGPSVALALQAAASHVAAWRASPPKERGAVPLLRALVAADAAAALDPKAPAPRIAAASLAGALGDRSACAAAGAALALKHVLLDTVAGHLTLPPLLAAGVEGGGGPSSSPSLLQATRAFHATAAAEVGSAMVAAFDAGSFAVALALAAFAGRLARSRAGAAADVEAAAAAVEAAAPGGARAAAAAAAAAAASPWADPDAARSLDFNDDLSVRPAWLAPPAGDLATSVAAWWEEEADRAGCWWARHAAAAGESSCAAAWRMSATGAIVRRALLPRLVAAALAAEPGRVAAAAAAWAATCPPVDPAHPPPLSRVALDAQGALWRAAVDVAAGRSGAAATALAAAGQAFTDAASTAAIALASRDAPLLTHGCWGAALALARAAGVAAACADGWLEKCGGGDGALTVAVCEFAAAVQRAADTLAATAPVDVAAAGHLAAALAESDPVLHDWVTAAGLDVGKRAQSLLGGQAAGRVARAMPGGSLNRD